MSILLILLLLKTKAQLNERDTLNWQVKLSASGSLLAGNVSRFLTVNKLETAHSTPLWGFSSRNDYQYGTRGFTKTENDVVSYLFIYKSPFKRIYPYIMGIIETNYRRKIRFRYQAGPGVSYRLIDKINRSIKISLTATYENTHFERNKLNNISDTIANIIKTWRVTARIFGRENLFEKKLHFLYECWWQQSVDNKRNYRFYSEEALEIPLNNYFSFRTGVRFTFESVGLIGLKPYDLFWTFGFSIKNF